MIKVVSWNIAKREKPWRELVEMDADVALVQEAGSPPSDLIDLVDYEDGVFWDRHLYDRWPLVFMIYGAIGHKLSLPERERTVWDRFQVLGLEFIGPQWPDACRQASSQPTDVPSDTKNVPTFYSLGGSPETALNQLDYAFASRGFHESVKVRALNEVDKDKWGSSDHCRLLIEVDCG